jgi:HEAT repeat protein
MSWLTPEALLVLLLWTLGVLASQLLLMMLVGAWLQMRRDRWNRMRIACHQKWENDIISYLYGGDRETLPFGILGKTERKFFIPFLLRVLGTLAGSEGDAVRALYHRMGLYQGLEKRLWSRQPKIRALAALEVGSFQVEAHFGRLLELLQDPAPHVGHAAARGLGNTQRGEYFGPLMQWVLDQEVFQQERLLWILESLGADFMRWLEARMDAEREPDLREWMIYALLAASTRRVEEPSRLIAMLDVRDLDVEAAAIKALGSLGHPEALPFVMPATRHPSWFIRGQAAKAVGVLAGPSGIPRLLDLICDPVFEVRRNAALALSHLGPAGVEALRYLAEDPDADPFARDLAIERLQWIRPMGAA